MEIDVRRPLGLPEDAKLVDDAGHGASVAAVFRSDRYRGDAAPYQVAGTIEHYYGERRTWGRRGRAMHWAWSPTVGEFDKRIVGGEPCWGHEKDYASAVNGR